MPEFLGLDIGTSFIKGAVLDLANRELRGIERVPFPSFVEGLPEPYREVDPGAILRAAGTFITQGSSRFDGVVICGQMHGFVLVNSRGEPVSNYISWLDRRVSPEVFSEIEALVSGRERAELGNELRPGIAVSLLYWLKRNGALPAGELTPLSVADYIAGRLCGTLPAMDPTQAAAFGAWDLAKGRWHTGIIRRLGLDSLRWPEVRPSGSVAGCWNGVPCYTAVGDQQCALAGALLAPEEISVNIGTGSQVAMLSVSPACEMWQTRPYFEGRFLRTITHIPGGRALSALVGLLTELGGASEEDAWPRIAAAVDAVPATDLRAAISFYPGPCGDRGVLENLHEGNLAVGHVFRAAFESMARNYRECARRLDPGGSARGLVFSGGVARRNGVLRELTASALGLPSRLSPHPEDTLFGLLTLARAFSGIEQLGLQSPEL